MADRYQVRNESDSGHCCFEATVVDTHTPTLVGPPERRSKLRDYSWVCECFEVDQAQRIADALNAAEASK